MATIRIEAKWDGRCKACGKPTLKGSEILYDYETKSAYHPGCSPNEQTGGLSDADANTLAEHLGFK